LFDVWYRLSEKLGTYDVWKARKISRKIGGLSRHEIGDILDHSKSGRYECAT
jgi:hypothetical protein